MRYATILTASIFLAACGGATSQESTTLPSNLVWQTVQIAEAPLSIEFPCSSPVQSEHDYADTGLRLKTFSCEREDSVITVNVIRGLADLPSSERETVLEQAVQGGSQSLERSFALHLRSATALNGHPHARRAEADFQSEGNPTRLRFDTYVHGTHIVQVIAAIRSSNFASVTDRVWNSLRWDAEPSWERPNDWSRQELGAESISFEMPGERRCTDPSPEEPRYICSKQAYREEMMIAFQPFPVDLGTPETRHQAFEELGQMIPEGASEPRFTATRSRGHEAIEASMFLASEGTRVRFYRRVVLVPSGYLTMVWGVPENTPMSFDEDKDRFFASVDFPQAAPTPVAPARTRRGNRR